jgi:hypothetical protein
MIAATVVPPGVREASSLRVVCASAKQPQANPANLQCHAHATGRSNVPEVHIGSATTALRHVLFERIFSTNGVVKKTPGDWNALSAAHRSSPSIDRSKDLCPTAVKRSGFESEEPRITGFLTQLEQGCQRRKTDCTWTKNNRLCLCCDRTGSVRLMAYKKRTASRRGPRTFGQGGEQ